MLGDDVYRESVDRGLDHVLGHINNAFGAEQALQYLADGVGSRYGCMSTLHSHSLARAMASYFSNNDLGGLKSWAHTAAKINRMLYQIEPTVSLVGSDHLMPLLSCDESLIKWFMDFDIPYSINGRHSNPKIVANPNNLGFAWYQIRLALRGDWEELERRCLHFFDVSPPRRKSYYADERFHLALVRGDRAGMESAISELLEPKLRKRRQDIDESGYTHWFISTYAVIYTKIAWRHGYQIDVDSPWVPKEWLPNTPLDHYEDPYPFMRDFDIHTPIEI